MSSDRGWSKQREREYDELVEEFEEEDRYEGREEEVAARIVNKQRSQYGETNEARSEDKEGKSPDQGLPVKNYDGLTVDAVVARMNKLSPDQIKEIREYERQHKNRETLLEQIDRKLSS